MRRSNSFSGQQATLQRRSSKSNFNSNNNNNNAILGDATSFIPPNIHVSVLIHPDGIALYGKLQTDPYFRESSIAPLLLEQKHQAEIAEKLNAMISEKQKQKFLRQQQIEKEQLMAQEEAKKKDLRSQLASNKAVVDVARAAYQHPVTAPVLKFPMAFDATVESICDEAVGHFGELLKTSLFGPPASRQNQQRKQRKNDKEMDESELNDDDEENDEEEDDDENDELEDILPTTNSEDLELYIYHIEDPDMFRKDFSIKGSFNEENDYSEITQRSKASRSASIMNDILAEQKQQQQQQFSRANRVNHTAVSIGDYDRSPPLLPEVPVRIQLNLFQLIAAARKRRRKFIVRSGLHPSAVEDCSPLNIFAVITVSPLWLERRALEIQEETAREDVGLNEQKYMRAIREAHSVSHSRALARAKGHRQIRAFNGEVENLFLKLALRNALVKQASMSVHDVVERHLQEWPQTTRLREAMFQQELKKRRCLLADYVQRLRLEERIRSIELAGEV